MSAAWAWIGDMELDDVALGLGAAGVFQKSAPLALGFVVNALHCVKKPAVVTSPNGDTYLGPVTETTEMYREKRQFLSLFFGGRFHAILDRYCSGGAARGWLQGISADALESIGAVCSLSDELDGWLSAVSSAACGVSTLHVLVSAPLVGRGVQLASGLEEGILLRSGLTTSIVLWMYGGRFNVENSSAEDVESMRNLLRRHPGRVRAVEATLKNGAWLCDPPRPFWSNSFPVAWSLESARQRPYQFDVSTDVQSLNALMEEYSTRTADGSKRGMLWVLQQIAAACADMGPGPKREGKAGEAGEAGEAAAVCGGSQFQIGSLLEYIQACSLSTNLTVMVSPTSSSMAGVREALAESAPADLLQEKYAQAAGALERMKEIPCGLQFAREACRDYAALYGGPDGRFVESGCSECFPPRPPFDGPRLDKRCILRCMARSQFQGGSPADFLVLLALLTTLPAWDPAALSSACAPLAAETRDACACTPGGAAGLAGVFAFHLSTSVATGDDVRRVIVPVIDEALLALVRGASLLGAAARDGVAGWGPDHGHLSR